MPATYALLGYPLTHSFSKGYFTQKFQKLGLADHFYNQVELKEIDNVRQVMEEQKDLAGFNVTIPHKINIIPYLDELSPEARSIGAVNTVKITRLNNSSKWMGYNTDVFGFEMSIKPFLESHHQKALILGTGGASKAVSFVMKKLGIEYLWVTRQPTRSNEIGYHQLNQFLFQQYLFVVNTTPLGMYPSIHEMPPIPYQWLTPKHLVMDLIYNPEQTLFLEKANMRGAKTLNGLSMLHLQAEKAWQIWTSNE